MVLIQACTVVFCFVSASGEHSKHATSEMHGEEDASVDSLCLLQRELSMNVQLNKVIATPTDIGGYTPLDVPTLPPLGEGSTEPVPSFSNGSSPVDSLMAPEQFKTDIAEKIWASHVDSSPVPGKLEKDVKEYLSWWRSASWSAALFGLMAVWVVFFLLLNLQPHKGCQMTLATAVNKLCSVFCAKLLFAAFCLFTAASLQAAGCAKVFWEQNLAGDADWQMLTVTLARVVILCTLVQGSIYVLCCCGGYHERVVSCISSVGAPLIGFALVDVCATRFRFHDFTHNADLGQFLLEGAFVILFLAAVMLSRTVCKSVSSGFFSGELTEDVQGSSQEHYTQDSLDIENITFSMVSGFLVFKLIERLILGEAAMKLWWVAGRFGVHSLDEILWLLIAAFMLAGLTLSVSALGYAWAIWKATVDGSNIGTYCSHSRVLGWLQGCCLMGTAWCLFGALSWTFSSASFQGLLLTGSASAPLFTALSASIVVIVLALVLGFCKGASGPSLLHHQGNSERYNYWLFASALGLLGGLAWATCFVYAARELSTNFPGKEHMVEGGLCMALALFVMPLWVMMLLPERRPVVLGNQVTPPLVKESSRGMSTPSWIQPRSMAGIDARRVPTGPAQALLPRPRSPTGQPQALAPGSTPWR